MVTADLADQYRTPATHMCHCIPLLPGSWEPMVVHGTLGSGVCPLAVVLIAVAVLLAGWLVALLVARRVGLLAVTPRTVRPAVVLGAWLLVVGVLVVEGAGVGRGWEDMVSRIQSFSLVIRVYTPGFLA